MVRRPVLYPRLHPWYIVVATADVLLTWVILSAFSGIELNPIAARVIDSHGMPGATFLKFATVMFVMWVSEFVGHHRDRAGRRLLWVALILNCVPVTVSVAQIAAA
ncbi:MAG TPA: hypothetical protein DEB06_03515, partial [Phycisphaerales bacterium]|nr:hypothetical protein [Phycisphaerales bacterium]